LAKGASGASEYLLEFQRQSRAAFNQQTFWAARFGMCVDRFGIPWLVNCNQGA
jgi:uncharacterized glyoxalase superfamily protein PhnB